jgi:prepilin-type N-terminal cleavage/methylation domain-containing protein
MNRRAFTIAEIIVALMLIGVCMLSISRIAYEFGKFNRYMLTRQRCISAAQAQLDSISTTGKAIEKDDIERLWPDVEVVINKKEGAGQWQNLVMVEAVATGSIGKRLVQVTLSRYMKPVDVDEGL